MLTGRGMFYGAANAQGGARIFSGAQWDAACRQAHAWGMSVMHPKVADGGYWWYDSAGLVMLRDTAKRYGLLCAPYHYCWGNSHNGAYGGLDAEAMRCAEIGNIFGVVCPDIESEWNNQHGWATRFGSLVRQHFSGEVYPTLFANPLDHPTPYPELERWITGWMPMVYFDLWRWPSTGLPDTAEQAIKFVFPQWLTLDTSLKNQGIPPKPILPIIETAGGLPPSEVGNWMRLMQNYGYCGFWYDGVYGPYAQAVLSSPIPGGGGKQPPAPQPSSPNDPTEGAIPVYDEGELAMSSSINQNLTLDELQVSWGAHDATIPFVPEHGLVRLWIELMQRGYPVGAPRKNEVPVLSGSGKKYAMLECEGGRLWYDEHDQRTWMQLKG